MKFPSTVARSSSQFVFIALLLLILLAIHITQGQAELDITTVVTAIVSPDNSIAHNLVRYVRLPRATIGIIAGAALGMAGVLLQTVTRNPLASPATLGINAGAYLAVTAAAIATPALLAQSPMIVALGGGLLAAMLVYGIAASVQVTPIRLTLAGVAVSLVLASFTALLQLFYENEIAGLFFWGAGSLVQTDWSGTVYAAPRVLVAAITAMLMAKSLDVLLLGDEMARSLGQRIQLTRFSATLVGIVLAAVAVSVVGPIGFIGLVAPHLGRLMGCRQHRLLLPIAALWGAVVLVGADVVAQIVTGNLSELPAGSVTALIGAPFLIWLVRTSKSMESGTTGERSLGDKSSHRLPYPVLLSVAILLLLCALVAGFFLGGTLVNWQQLLSGNSTPLSQRVLLHLRLPRLLVAVLAGASLAVSGLLLQGVVRNPLAGPEIIGITSGAGFGAVFVLVLLPNAPIEAVPVAAFIGAFAAFGCVYLAAWRGGISPARLALVGIAVSAFCSAGINLLVAIAKLRVAQALVWLVGSTYARSWDELWRLLAFPLILLPLAWLVARWLDLMALGEDLPRTLGLPLQKARAISVAIAVALAAAAVSTVGTVSFVGLLAPHAARLLVGCRHRQLVPIAAILGAILVTVADIIGRIALAPREIPSGLVTAMIGTPYFLWLLWSNTNRTYGNVTALASPQLNQEQD
ncbi:MULTISPECIES: Fe(3+)-hydroxamate ABC transporter permease FhuB [unclassified Coleofasciculus]|uniref:Fe(3+)-hydroxamate ABC transporter permease FhuB n=1 Tax=unclassified Coleofasciculus TaxID=2692782 RepID=UPI00187FEF40|nr:MULTISPECIES: Fe(3+)-hydroxamate ABC transporter permease FhuB [unclassified Coleofasciculus]MBE9125217.1 Fe(3+)-hydroxamate ABC transporter permease FhuB [Coleofasciculus sp. LEGE 07081]MBE9148430.1 Fe(3+)-hydroxamate ABC transporter permease FhuB [Coleofasciculus sp. LEGE 07092]